MAERSIEQRRPLIVTIRRGSREDGPGIRTVVFFKGCPLRCCFCQNPETQHPGVEIAFAIERCIHCGVCADACSRSAIQLHIDERLNRALCDSCGECADVCPSGALRSIGLYWPIQDLVEYLVRDIPFYRHSGGGVTLSGGECTMFPEYLHKLLVHLHDKNVHVALQTSGCFEWDVFKERILPFVNLVVFDLKVFESTDAVRHIGQPSEPILRNLKRLLSEAAVDVHPRIPLIPGVTDGEKNLTSMLKFLRHSGAKQFSVLPYSPLGLATYARLGRLTPALPHAFGDPKCEAELILELQKITSDKS